MLTTYMPGTVLSALERLTYSSHNPEDGGTIITLILHTWKLKRREVKYFAQGHTVSDWGTRNSNPDSLAPGLGRDNLSKGGMDLKVKALRLSYLHYNMKVWQFSVLMAKKFSVSPFYAGVRVIQEKKSKKFQGIHLTLNICYSGVHHIIILYAETQAWWGRRHRQASAGPWGPGRGAGWGAATSSLSGGLVPRVPL